MSLSPSQLQTSEVHAAAILQLRGCSTSFTSLVSHPGPRSATQRQHQLLQATPPLLARSAQSSMPLPTAAAPSAFSVLGGAGIPRPARTALPGG